MYGGGRFFIGGKQGGSMLGWKYDEHSERNRIFTIILLMIFTSRQWICREAGKEQIYGN